MIRNPWTFVALRDHFRYPPFDTGLAKSGHNKRRSLLQWRPKYRKESCDLALRAVSFFDEIHRDTPPGKQRAQHPEVSGCFHAGLNAGSGGKNAASDGGADGQRKEQSCQNEVSGQ